VLPGGGAEQEPEDWWQAVCETTGRTLAAAGIPGEAVSGLAFCTQMQGLVLVDENGVPVRRAMSYMDQRAAAELKAGLAGGLTLAGCNIVKLARSLAITRVAATSVKDPVWKYKWVERHEPEAFARVKYWLDVKEYLVYRCCGKFVMTPDSAFSTMLYDIRKGRGVISRTMCAMLGVRYEHLPRLIASTEHAGGLTERAAEALGLRAGTPVFGGGGDASLVGVGAGATALGATHIYCGTSGWVSTVVDRPMVDLSAKIAAVVGANPGHYNYFAELETAGKCLEWVKDHLALDEIGIYLEKKHVSDSQEAIYKSLYDYMMHVVTRIPAGSSGVIFAPWLHGNRCPFEDSSARGMFINIGLDTGKTHLIRAVLEGVCYHMRWMLEAQEKKTSTSEVIRFVGGGALSPVTCQILSDILGRRVETVAHPQNVGAVGAAVTAAVGLGLIGCVCDAEQLIRADCEYVPQAENRKLYDTGFAAYKNLYRDNRRSFAARVAILSCL
jgi:xylulokinase